MHADVGRAGTVPEIYACQRKWSAEGHYLHRRAEEIFCRQEEADELFSLVAATTISPISWQRLYNVALSGLPFSAGHSERNNMRPFAQSASLLRVGCQRSPKPSGESTTSAPPALNIALPQAFSHGLMNVPTPAPPGPMRAAFAMASRHSSPPSAHLREHRKGSIIGRSRRAVLP